MEFSTFNGFDIALGALLALLIIALAYAAHMARQAREVPVERARAFDFKLADDLADERGQREFRKASAYREHYFEPVESIPRVS